MKIPRAIDRWLRRLLVKYGQPFDFAEERRSDVRLFAEIGANILHDASDSFTREYNRILPAASAESRAKADAQVAELRRRLDELGSAYAARIRKPEGDL